MKKLLSLVGAKYFTVIAGRVLGMDGFTAITDNLPEPTKAGLGSLKILPSSEDYHPLYCVGDSEFIRAYDNPGCSKHTHSQWLLNVILNQNSPSAVEGRFFDICDEDDVPFIDIQIESVRSQIDNEVYYKCTLFNNNSWVGEFSASYVYFPTRNFTLRGTFCAVIDCSHYDVVLRLGEYKTAIEIGLGDEVPYALAVMLYGGAVEGLHYDMENGYLNKIV